MTGRKTTWIVIAVAACTAEVWWLASVGCLWTAVFVGVFGGLPVIGWAANTIFRGD